MRADPEIAGELVWAGIDMVARANNHAGDWGAEGLRLTTRHVEEGRARARRCRREPSGSARGAFPGDRKGPGRTRVRCRRPSPITRGRAAPGGTTRPGPASARCVTPACASPPPQVLTGCARCLDNMQLPYSQNGILLNALGHDLRAGARTWRAHHAQRPGHGRDRRRREQRQPPGRLRHRHHPRARKRGKPRGARRVRGHICAGR